MRVRAYFFGGLKGAWFSTGMKDAVDALNLIPGVTATYHLDYWNWQTHAEEIKKLDRSVKIVIGGHSFGASAALYLATAVERDFRTVHRLITVDPSKWWSSTFGNNPIPVVPSNVIEAVNFRIAFGFVGAGELQPDADDLDMSEERIENIIIRTFHVRIDNKEAVKQRIVQEARECLAIR